MTFSGPDAVQEIIVRYTAPSGFCLTHTCPGGTELDSELPWISRESSTATVSGNRAAAVYVERSAMLRSLPDGKPKMRKT